MLNAIIQRVAAGEALTLRGPQAVEFAQRLLAQAVHSAGYAVTFDPDSSPDLVDYLAVTAVEAVGAAALLGGLGALLGLLFGRPALGATIGTGVGLAAGAARGFQNVQRGLRVRAVRELDGTPNVTIHRLTPG
jgi:hypothetical protein